MEALAGSPAPPRRMRLVSTSSGPVRRRARRGFPHQQPADIDMQLGLECDSGDATHLVDDHGEMMPTPQALRNVLRDPGVRAILSKQRAAILAAMGKEDATGEGSVPTAAFRRVMLALQPGFKPAQVEDLEHSLLFLARVGRERGGLPASGLGGPELVPYCLLFSEEAPEPPPPSPAQLAAGEGLAGAAAQAFEDRTAARDGESGEEDETPALPNAIPRDAHVRAQEAEEPDHPTPAARGEGVSARMIEGRTVSTALRARAAASARFRLPSVEDLLDAAPITAAAVRASVPELLASADVSVNLSAYSSIGVIAVFFASLSITCTTALLASARVRRPDPASPHPDLTLCNANGQELESAPWILTLTFAAHSLVIVLNVFTVLSMSMVYYYGQLHIGHGFNETATHFVRNPLVKRLRHASLDAFWASAPLFMIAMALTFLSQVRSAAALMPCRATAGAGLWACA